MAIFIRPFIHFKYENGQPAVFFVMITTIPLSVFVVENLRSFFICSLDHNVTT